MMRSFERAARAGHRRRRSGGFAIIVVLVVLVVMMSMMAVISGHLLRSKRRVFLAARKARTLALAEGGVQKALRHIAAGDTSYSGERETPLGKGCFTVSVRDLPEKPGHKEIISTGNLELGAPKNSSDEGPHSPVARLRVIVRLVPSPAPDQAQAPAVKIVSWQRLR